MVNLLEGTPACSLSIVDNHSVLVKTSEIFLSVFGGMFREL
jgi:hypothetical protein